MIPTDSIGIFQLSLVLGSALDATSFVVLWRLGGAGEDPKQMGFCAEPSSISVSVGALLFAESVGRGVDGRFRLEAVFAEGAERTVEGLVETEGAFAKGEDVVAGEESRSIALIDVPIIAMCSTSDDGCFMLVG